MPENHNELVEKLATHLAAMTALLDRLKGRKPVISDKVREAVAYHLANRICLICEKKKPDNRFTRGLCASDYNETIKAINNGSVNEIDLIEAGRITEEPQAGGRKADRLPIRELAAIPISMPRSSSVSLLSPDDAYHKHSPDAPKRKERKAKSK